MKAQPQWGDQNAAYPSTNQNIYGQPNPYASQPPSGYQANPYQQNPYQQQSQFQQQNPYATNPAYGYTGTNATHLANPPQPGVAYTTSTATPGVDMPVQGIPLYPESNEPKAKKFVVQGYQDLWAAILFILCMIGCIVLGIYNFSTSFGETEHREGTEAPVLRDEVGLSSATLVGLLFGMVALAALLATISLLLFSKFPLQAIIAANVASIVMMVISSIVSFVLGSVFAGVITLLFAIINAVILYVYRSRIPFSALLMKTCSGIAITYKGLIFSNYALVALFAVFTIMWTSAVYPSVYRLNENNGTASGGDGAIVLYCMFCYFWASQVAFNTMHVTTSGVTATWYFVGGDAHMPRNPTLASFKRAVTTSFGSICFGSLLVAILKFLQYVVRSQRENENDFISCIVLCLLRCLESLLEYFNHFAFVYCAIYGYDYITAAKKTFALASNCAFAATFNESLVNTTLVVTSLAASLIGFLVFWGTVNMAVGIVAFFITLFVHVQVFRVLDSSTTALFICFAEEPNTLAIVNRELYERIYAAGNGNASAV